MNICASRDQLWTGFEPLDAAPMKDRDLFEFLGFD